MKKIVYLSLLLAAFSCKKTETVEEAKGPESIVQQKTTESISGKTLSSGYIYVEFNAGGKLYIYQSTPGSYVRGCTADGTWSQENDNINIQITQSYCPTQSYSNLNGIYKFDGTCIKNNSESLCK